VNTVPDFEINENQESGWLRLSLTGELDIGSTPTLEDRLTRLRVKKMAVRLDLSQLEFIDSTGLHLLIRALGDARIDGWQLEIDPDVAPRVMRLFKLVHFDRLLPPSDGNVAVARERPDGVAPDGTSA
jgi:anti-anti-sigma factor